MCLNHCKNKKLCKKKLFLVHENFIRISKKMNSGDILAEKIVRFYRKYILSNMRNEEQLCPLTVDKYTVISTLLHCVDLE